MAMTVRQARALGLLRQPSNNGAADEPRRAVKPPAVPPGVGFIRWLCGAKRQASSGWSSAAPLSRARSVRDHDPVQPPAQRSGSAATAGWAALGREFDT